MRTYNTRYSEQVEPLHRKEYGQFFTHPVVADFMVRWILQSQRKSLYDPAFGLGAFLDPISDDLEIKFTGSEIDSKILNFWKNMTNGRHVQIANEDYLLSWGKSHTNIVCNPPYMRFQKFLNRNAVFRAFAGNLDLKLSGYTNTASTFLLKSLSELNGSGRLAYIMPLEFLNTGYGTIVKRRLIEDGHLVSMISLDCEKDIFPDAITSVGIVLYDATRRYSHVDFHVATSIHSLTNILNSTPVNRIALDSLNPKLKWLSYFQPTDFSINTQMTVPLNYYGHFSRGIATGANKFFVLRPSRAKELGIPLGERLQCITKSSQIQRLVFDCEDYNNLVENDDAVILFNAGCNHSERAAAYIQSGEREGYNARFLTKNRNPWYITERRCPSPFLIGVFSRGGYKIVRNRSKALNLTCFHGFQPNVFGNLYIDQLFLYLASTAGQDIVLLSKRRYGDALDKFEPNDLNNAIAPAPHVFDELSTGDVEDAVSHAKEICEIPDWVDGFFKRLKTEAQEAKKTTLYIS